MFELHTNIGFILYDLSLIEKYYDVTIFCVTVIRKAYDGSET